MPSCCHSDLQPSILVANRPRGCWPVICVMLLGMSAADRWMDDMEDACHDWYFWDLLQSLQAKAMILSQKKYCLITRSQFRAWILIITLDNTEISQIRNGTCEPSITWMNWRLPREVTSTYNVQIPLIYVWESGDLTIPMRSEISTAVTMKNTVFFDMQSCSRVEVYRRFRGVYCIRLESWRLKSLRKHHGC